MATEVASDDVCVTEAEVLEFLKAYERASSSEDFSNVAGMIHPDAMFRFNDGDYVGLAAIKEFFEWIRAHDVKDEQYVLSDAGVRYAGKNSAAVTFTFTWSGVSERGRFEIVGCGTSVLVRDDGALKIIVEQLSR